MNQKATILKHLRKRSLTQAEAFNRYGIGRLAARIEELRRVHDIRTDLVEVRNRYGETARVARYTLL